MVLYMLLYQGTLPDGDPCCVVVDHRQSLGKGPGFTVGVHSHLELKHTHRCTGTQHHVECHFIKYDREGYKGDNVYKVGVDQYVGFVMWLCLEIHIYSVLTNAIYQTYS